eukprot:3914863-Rhodomonas_salina.1
MANVTCSRHVRGLNEPTIDILGGYVTPCFFSPPLLQDLMSEAGVKGYGRWCAVSYTHLRAHETEADL